MNKENQFIDNEVSTGIHDSCSKTYSSRFLQTQKKVTSKNKLLPSKYEKSVIIIQRYWRFRLYMKRKVCQKIINELQEQNECYELQNNILNTLITQHQTIVKFKEQLLNIRTKQVCSDHQSQTSQLKKQCVMASFQLQKKNPKKQLLSQIIQQKQEQLDLNFMLHREKLIVDEQLEEQKKENQNLLEQLKKLNQQHLELVKQKHLLSHINAERLLETSKFASNDFRTDSSHG